MISIFKCYRQLEHSDCGLTCIRMIARYFGKKIPMEYLHKISDLNRLGMSVGDLVQICKKIGITATIIKIGEKHISAMPLPAILYWRQNHFVVLYKIKNNNFYISDPAQGKIKYNKEEFYKYFFLQNEQKGIAALIAPQELFYKINFPYDYALNRFLNYVCSFFRYNRKNFLIALIISLFIMASDLFMPIFLRRTIDDGVLQKDVNIVFLTLTSQLIITIGGLVASSVMDILFTKIGLDVYIEMVVAFLKRLAGFPISFFDRKVSSDFVQKISDQTRIKDFLVSTPNSMLLTLLTFLVFSTLLFHYSPCVFIIFVFMSLIEILWNFLFLNKKKTLDYAFFTYSSENRNHAYELTNGMPDLKINNAEYTRIKNWEKTQKALNNVTMKASYLGILQNGGHTIISRMKELTITGLAAYLVIEGNMTIGIMMTLSYIIGRLSVPFNNISAFVSAFQEAFLSFQRITDVVDGSDDIKGSEKFLHPSVSLNNVWFKYAGADSPYVIKDCSLAIIHGKVNAIVGESGCGKSTLIKLMLGFYIPQKGTIMLSGYPINQLDNEDWLRHCGVVMQESKIFSGSIVENVSLCDEHPDLNKIFDLINAVGLSDFIQQLPMGIFTKLGVAGIEMSGGQKQRLMIARALYKSPDILFLDEATSFLDANNESMIIKNIQKIEHGKTIVVAAHRLSTIKNADNIIVLKEGRIVEQGTHQKLLLNEGVYWHLVNNQLRTSFYS